MGPNNPIVEFFECDHLADDLRSIAIHCKDLATAMDKRLERSPETTTGLRKLLEAKDCFVRARILMRKDEE